MMARASSILAAVRALTSGGAWLEDARRRYRAAGLAAAAGLGLPAPQGSTFLFLDVTARLDDRGIGGFLADCFEDGVLVAPGGSSGTDYETWIRLCYTAAPPEEVARAIERLARRAGVVSR